MSRLKLSVEALASLLKHADEEGECPTCGNSMRPVPQLKMVEWNEVIWYCCTCGTLSHPVLDIGNGEDTLIVTPDSIRTIIEGLRVMEGTLKEEDKTKFPELAIGVVAAAKTDKKFTRVRLAQIAKKEENNAEQN